MQNELPDLQEEVVAAGVCDAAILGPGIIIYVIAAGSGGGGPAL